ncbi:MAG: hypothetical protein HYX80_05895 [Chloroflexi bacterium]|nr:hypothetical protein [Chloroflexota bacterium]
MAPRRRASRKTRSAAGHRKGATHGRRFSKLLLGITLLLIGGIVVVTLVFQGREGTGGPRPLAVLRTADYHSLAFSPENPLVVFFGHHDGIMRSDDGGKTWRRLIEQRNFDAMAVVVDHRDSRLVYLAGHDVFEVSQDGGLTWRPVQHDLPGTDIHGLAVSPEDRLFAFVVGYGLFSSSDAGLTWVRLSAQLPRDVMAVAAGRGSPETLYVASIGQGVLKSGDGGQTWVQAGGGLGSGAVRAMALDPGAPNTVYAGGTSGLYKSADSGDFWTKLAFPGNNIVSLAISPAQPGLLLAINIVKGEGQVYRSEDGGLTWGR